MADERIPLDGGDDLFDPDNLVKTVIAVPLLLAINQDPEAMRRVIIDVNVRYAAGRAAAQNDILTMIGNALEAAGDQPGQGANLFKSRASSQYVYARLQGKVIRKLVEIDQGRDTRAIYHVWPDFAVHPHIWKSVPTVKADACRRAFAATGKGIVWAVLDSGIDGSHPHFDKHANLKELPCPLQHMDFTADPPVALPHPTDDFGHGTHVAGIIAGHYDHPLAIFRERNPQGRVTYTRKPMPEVDSVAPECKLVSYKVITGAPDDPVSNVIAALEHIQEINGYGRRILIHGVNMSLGTTLTRSGSPAAKARYALKWTVWCKRRGRRHRRR